MLRRSGIACSKLRNSAPFHKSWFDKTGQTSDSVVAADFSSNLQEQSFAFSSKGFTIVRRSESQNIDDLAALNDAIILQLKESESSSCYNLMRYFRFSSVRAPELRHAFSLPMTALLNKVITAAISKVGPFLETEFSLNSPLVDLSSIVSFPGSKRQKTHSDVPYSDSYKIVSGFVALSRVNLNSGPTCLFAGTHLEAFHSEHVDNKIFEASHYGSDGSPDLEDGSTPMKTNAHCAGRGEYTEEMKLQRSQDVDLAAASPAHAAILEIGDVLLYDTKLFHYGGANTSTSPRALLMFSFQQCTPWGSVEKVSGFTYHMHSTVAGKYCLGSFTAELE